MSVLSVPCTQIVFPFETCSAMRIASSPQMSTANQFVLSSSTAPSVISGLRPPLTAKRTFATHVPLGKCRISGSAPTLPMIVTLFASSGDHVTVLGGAVVPCPPPSPNDFARVDRGPAGVYDPPRWANCACAASVRRDADARPRPTRVACIIVPRPRSAPVVIARALESDAVDTPVRRARSIARASMRRAGAATFDDFECPRFPAISP